MIDFSINFDSSPGSVRIVYSDHAYITTTDWSDCRSQGRARRRLRRGFKQRTRSVQKPQIYRCGNSIIAHPDLRGRIEEEFKHHPRARRISPAGDPSIRGNSIDYVFYDELRDLKMIPVHMIGSRFISYMVPPKPFFLSHVKPGIVTC